MHVFWNAGAFWNGGRGALCCGPWRDVVWHVWCVWCCVWRGVFYGAFFYGVFGGVLNCCRCWWSRGAGEGSLRFPVAGHRSSCRYSRAGVWKRGGQR